MIVDDANVISNHERYNIRDIHKTIRSLSDEQKQSLLASIETRKGAFSLVGREYNQETCNRIESLLNGKRPKNGDGHS